VTERDPAPATATSTTTEPPVRETTTTTAAPAPVPPAPCAKYDGNEPYFVVCGPVSLKVGEPGLYDLVAQGRIRDDCGSPTVDWGDGDGNVVCMIACESYPEQPRSIERKFQHTYAEPGIFTVRFTLQGCGPDYRPQASVVMEVQVT
jgi:hypothetical protein